MIWQEERIKFTSDVLLHAHKKFIFPLKFQSRKLRLEFRNFAALSRMCSQYDKISIYLSLKRRCKLQCISKNFDANRPKCTLVHKRPKIGPEFRPNQRAAIIATHSNQIKSIKTFATAPVTDDHWRRTSNPIKSIDKNRITN